MSGQISVLRPHTPRKGVWVVYDFYRSQKRMWAAMAHILPEEAVPHRLLRDWGGGEVEVLERSAEPLFLSAFQRYLVSESLFIQSKKPSYFIIPVTVHGRNKARKNQGVVFALKTKHIVLPSKYYDYPTRPCKGIFCPFEEDYKKIEEMIKIALLKSK